MGRPLKTDTLIILKNTENIIYEKTIFYNTGIYVRLSIENSGNKNTDTIENQIEIAKNFISKEKDLKLTDIYCDNGKSGTNFQRPEFNRLINDIKLKKINCIVVKDLSRFGRNFVETGNYIERIFPYLDVRFISINDNFDTFKSNNNNIFITLKNLINEYYSKDISNKILSSLKIKQKEGKYLSGTPPYGYLRSEKNKYLLVPDKYTSPVVKKIFNLKLKNMSNLSISRYLNEQGIYSPSKYKYERGLIKKANSKNILWTERTINFILRNKIYTGYMVVGKTKKTNYKTKKKLYISDSEWIIIPDMHEPIIDSESFYKVKQILDKLAEKYKSKKSNYPEHTENILKGKVVCGYCETILSRVRERENTKNLIFHYNYRCRQYKENKELACSLKGRIREDYLLNSIYFSIKLLICLFYEINQKSELREIDIINTIDKYKKLLKKNNQKDFAESKEILTLKEKDIISKIANNFINYIKVYNNKKIELNFKFSNILERSD